MRIRSGLVGLVMGFGVAYSGACDSDSSQPTTSCVTDYDCKGDRVCEGGVCSGGSSGNSGDVTYTCESGVEAVYQKCSDKSINHPEVDDAKSDCKQDYQMYGGDINGFFRCVVESCRDYTSGDIVKKAIDKCAPDYGGHEFGF